MKNYIYITGNQARVEVYYIKATNLKNAINQALKLANLPAHYKEYIKKDIRKLNSSELIYEYDYPDYEG